MSQRINISYTIELSDLKDEVERLLTRIENRLDSCVSDFSREISNSSPLEMSQLESIDLLRQRLSDIDYSLSDTSAIISSYNSYLLSLQADSPEEQVEQPDLERIKETINNLRSLKSESNEVAD